MDEQGAGGNDLFECALLKASISPLQCLTNRIKAMTLKNYPALGTGYLGACLRCEIGRQVRAYLPGPPESPLTGR
jgi:hypothetical protein